jgi:hypothetical protein
MQMAIYKERKQKTAGLCLPAGAGAWPAKMAQSAAGSISNSPSPSTKRPSTYIFFIVLTKDPLQTNLLSTKMLPKALQFQKK